jgi:NAD(P)-dependent dehydrogenase (short-subunit alcohol dehydrogenase family)
MTSQSDLMRDRVCMVTGATSGIGLKTAEALAKLGATLVLVGRNPEKGASTVAHIQEETGNPSLEFLRADLSVLSQVRRLAREFADRYARLNVLLNNAGAFRMRRQLSADGIEMTFALNYLSPFLLTNLLLDTLKTSAPARIINVSSDMHQGAQINFQDLEGERRYSGMKAYGQSKLALVLFTYELARRLEGTQVTANALHPGFVATNIYAASGGIVKLVAPLIKGMAMSPEKGAQTSIYLASSPEVVGVSGQYFIKEAPARSAPITYDRAVAQRLWEISLQMTGL